MEELLQDDVKELITEFIEKNGENRKIVNKSNNKTILKAENNALTLYQTRLAQKEEGKMYIIEPPKEDIPDKLYGTVRQRTVAIIEFLIEKAKKSTYYLIMVPFELNYGGDLKERNVGSTLCRNVIFSGTPGAGKSYFVDHFVIPEILSGVAIPEGQSKAECYQQHTTRVTFTEGYTREDFFGCYKPVAKQDGALTYEFVPGPFCRAVRSALTEPEKNYVLVIEELNRGNVYEILGDIFQLLDREADGRSSYPIALSVDSEMWFKRELQDTKAVAWFDADHFRIPGNLYIICTMNNADARVQFLDTAFKRRFASAYMDEEGHVYAAGNIPGVMLAQKDANMRDSVFCVREFMSRGRYDHIRRKINNVLQREGYPEDKWVAARFVRFERGPNGDERLREMEFVTGVLGYLLQNVFRGREQTDQFASVFQKECPHSLGLLLKKYCEDKSLQNILADDILR